MLRHKEDLKKVIETLEYAQRQGGEKDSPEGTRYITISDTLARDMVDKLNELSISLYCEAF